MAEAQKFANAAISPITRAEMFSGAILGHVEWLTLVLGAAGAAWAAWRWGWRGGLGLAFGAALSWVNYRWLKGSIRAFGRVTPAGVPDNHEAASSAAAAGAANGNGGAAHVPKAAYFKFIGRYALLLGGVYVILTRTSLPAVSVLLGLFAAGAGVIVAIVYESLRSGAQQAFGKSQRGS